MSKLCLNHVTEVITTRDYKPRQNSIAATSPLPGLQQVLPLLSWSVRNMKREEREKTQTDWAPALHTACASEAANSFREADI